MDQARNLREAHRDLLRAVRDKPVGTEAGAVYTPDMKLLERRIGKAHSVHLPRYSGEHILIHNHPDGAVFSIEDINSFGLRFDTTVMTAVGNNGCVYLLRKTEEYDPVGFAMAFNKDLVTKLSYESTKKEVIDTITAFLKGAKTYGIEFDSGTKGIL